MGCSRQGRWYAWIQHNDLTLLQLIQLVCFSHGVGRYDIINGQHRAVVLTHSEHKAQVQEALRMYQTDHEQRYSPSGYVLKKDTPATVCAFIACSM